jgi:hypothetical protein
VIEAVVAAALMLSAMACLQSISGYPPQDGSDDVARMTTDLMYILEHGQNRPDRPGIAQALSSQSAWEDMSAALESDLRSRMPAGYHVWMDTPYGDIGDCPPDRATMSVRPFIAYRQETGEMIECSLIVWRR